MKGSINFKKMCFSRKKATLIIIMFLIISNFIIPIVLDSSNNSDFTTQDFFNLDIFNAPNKKDPITNPNIPLKTLSNGEFMGYGNNRSVIAYFDSYGSTNGNSTNLEIDTNGWDMKSLNFTIDQLRAHNHTKVLEDQVGAYSVVISSSILYLMSFNISDDANLTEVNFYLTSNADNATILIYNSNTSAKPNNLYKKIEVGGYNVGAGAWVNYSLSENNSLKISETNNQTFFIGINRTGLPIKNWWGNIDGVDGGKIYFSNGLTWQEDPGRDLTLKLKFIPLNETPNPSDINLKINGQNVLNNFTWKNSSRFNATGSNIIFDIDSTWGNITYRANWTATLIQNLNGIANFSANSTNNIVNWNVSISNLDFGAISSNKQINVSLPISWNISAVFSDSTPYGNFDNVTEDNLKILRIFDPPNSSWNIGAESQNYITSIKLYKGSNEVNTSIIFEEIKVNGTLKNVYYNDTSNLTIILSGVEKNTTVFTPNGNISIDVALNDSFGIITNGNYTFRLTFSNGTEVGFNKTYLNILNKTYLTDISPEAQRTIYYSGALLNITMNFTMAYWNGLNFTQQPIDNLSGGNVTYNLPEITGNSWIPLVYNPTSKVWTITILLNIDIGKYEVYVNASKDGAEYQSTSRNIEIIYFNGTIKGKGDPRPIIIQGYENGTNLFGDESEIQLPVHGHNLTYANFTIFNISSINKKILQNYDLYGYYNITDKTYAMKFNISATSYLTKVGFQLYIDHFSSSQWTNLNVYLWNATWNGSRIEPDKIIWNDLNNPSLIGPINQRKFELNVPNLYLDTSLTDNNSYFLSVNGTAVGPPNLSPFWLYTNDSIDGNDMGEAYDFTGGIWTLLDKDFWVNVTINTYKNASQLSLNISNIPVSDNPTLKYSGFWESSNTYLADLSGNVSLSVQANESVISYIINYTIIYENNSVDSLTKYTFNITESVIKWNVSFIATLPDIAFNGSINITYPKSWNVSLIYTPNKSNYSNTEIQNLGNLKLLLIKNISSSYNGTWNIIFYSNKFTSNIWIWNNTGGGYQQVNNAYITNTIKINATVTNAINGWGNISVFNSKDTLINLISLAAPTQNSDYDFPDLTLMDNLTTDGNSTVLFLWNNGTEVSGEIAFLYVRNVSSLVVISPEFPELQGDLIEGIKGGTFNLTVYFNMSYWDNGWTSIAINDSPSTTVSYQTNSLDIANPISGNLTFIGNGTWTKIFNFPTINASYYLFINASSEDIRPSNRNFTLIVSNSSNLELTLPLQSVFWGENVTFSLNYTDQISGSPIIGANVTKVNYTIASLSQSGILIENSNYITTSQNGIYNITIISRTLSNYTYNITFKLNVIGFQTKSQTGTLFVNNRTTTLTLVVAPTPIFLGDNVSVMIFYEDTINNSGITEAIIKTNASALLDFTVIPVAGEPGNYSITMNSSNFNNIGTYLIEFNASKNLYDIAYLNVFVQVSWFYTNLTPISGVNGTIYDWNISVMLNSSQKIQVKYLNLWDNSLVEDALIDAYFEGQLLSTSQLGNGNYSITLDTSIISNPDINENYTLNVTMYKTGYEAQTINITVKFFPLTTILTPIRDYINASHNEVISIDVVLTNINLENIGPSFGIITYNITNSSGGYYKNGTLNYQLGYYTGSVQLLSTDLANGSYDIIVNFSSSFNFYLNSSCTIALNFSISTPIIQTVIEFVNLPSKVNESTYIDIIMNLTNAQKTETIPSGSVEITIIASFEDGSTQTNITNKLTDLSGVINISYFVPSESISVYISANYYGSSQYEQSSNSSSILVIRQRIDLELLLLPPLFVPEGLPLLITGKIETENGTVPIGTIVMSISVALSIATMPIIHTFSINFTPSSKGIFIYIIPIPENIFSVSVSATYYGTRGYKVEASPRAVAILNELEYFIRENFYLLLISSLIIAIVIIGIITYFKAIRPKTETLTTKKKRLMTQRIETTKELVKITKELDKLRGETLAQAQKAERDGLLEEAAKAYEKVGNLSLELAEKSIAKDYFARARVLMKNVTKKELISKREEERKKLIESARMALREKNVLKASKYYSKIVAISIQLGDLETAQRFSNLIASTEDQIKLLKDQELRTELKGILQKADKAMGKQKFGIAAKHFEEASRLLLLLDEPEGVKKFSGWAKLARERQEIFSEEVTDWKAELNMIIEDTKKVVEKKKEEADYDQVILNLIKIAIYYLEIEDENMYREYRQRAKSFSDKLKIFRTDRRSKIESEKLRILQKAERAESEHDFKIAAELYEKAAKLAIDLGDRNEGKQIMEKAQILFKQAKRWAESEKLEKLKELEKPIKPAPKIVAIPVKPKLITELPRPKPIRPIFERAKPVELPEIKVLPKPIEPEKIVIKPIVEKPIMIPKAIPKEILPTKEEQKTENIRNQIDKLHTLVFDCQKNKRLNTAIYYYKVASNLAKQINDKRLVDSYFLKLEELKVSTPQKIESRDKIRKLIESSENKIRNKKFAKAIEELKDIAEIFFSMGDEQGGIDFLERINEIQK
ncbi:MAG: hypothetical protein HWN67_06015 [Candidatus Helarchaeota archaeon]|nr:hypothetical protein [Candidatus Helarchaeota archaeon]